MNKFQRIFSKDHYRWLAYLAVIFPLLSLSPILSPDYAQEGGLWSPPVSLTHGMLDSNGRLVNSIAPTLVVDAIGNVHAFWVTQRNLQASDTGSSLFYSRWNGYTWSIPLDIFYNPSSDLSSPQAAVGYDDRIHLVWVGGGTVWYSQVPASEAGVVRAWSQPMPVSNAVNVNNASVAVAPDGSIHIVYSALENDKQQIFYIWSQDGKDWFSPVTIGGMTSEINYVVARLAIDERSRIHVVFGEAGAGYAVYYSKSMDNGYSWSIPLTIDKCNDRYNQGYCPAWISVITQGMDEVHLVWDGAPSGQRWHQWSEDGGNTWAEPVQISSDVRGLSGTNAMGFDAAGRLHLFSMGITGTGPYYASWLNGLWSPLVPIAGQGWDGEGPALAISDDQIVVAWWDRSPGAIEILTSEKKINVPSISTKLPATTPTVTLLPIHTSVTATLAGSSANVNSAQDSLSGYQQSDSISATSLLLIGILPAALLTIFIFLLIFIKRK